MSVQVAVLVGRYNISVSDQVLCNFPKENQPWNEKEIHDDIDRFPIFKKRFPFLTATAAYFSAHKYSESQLSAGLGRVNRPWVSSYEQVRYWWYVRVLHCHTVLQHPGFDMDQPYLMYLPSPPHTPDPQSVVITAHSLAVERYHCTGILPISIFK